MIESCMGMLDLRMNSVLVISVCGVESVFNDIFFSVVGE